MKIAVLCPSEIAVRRFMPALNQIKEFEFVGIGVNSVTERYGKNLPPEKEIQDMLASENKKADAFIAAYGGRKFSSYEEVISADYIDAVYIPLPPALHYKWAKKALENGKHVLVEKPATISYKDTIDLIETAKEKDLAIHENYMFIYHNQLDSIDEIIKSGEIGDVRLYRITFGFPRRSPNDFRYSKALGGGSLIDAGGYTIKYATRLLGDSVKISYGVLNYLDEFNVDIFGSAALVNDTGTTAQVAFGMDNDYRCELEVWGSKGTLRTGRVLTAPAGFVPSVAITKNNEVEVRKLPADDTFRKSIERFILAIKDIDVRMNNYDNIQNQARLMEDFLILSFRGK